MGLPAMPAPGHGNWNRLWNGEQNLEGEKRILDHRRFGVWPRVNFRYESKAIVLPLQPKSHHFQHPPPSSMVNVSSGISSSSVLKFQIEPPSNQNFRDKSYGPLTPAEEKMVAMKRSYPFSVESQSAPSCRCKFQPTSVSSISQSDESASYSNGCTTHLEPSNKSIRDDPSNTTPLPEQNASGSIRENRELNGDILTLAPPAPAASLLGSKHKHPPANSGCPRHGILDFRSPSSKEFTRDPIGNPRPGGLTERSPFSFFPPKDQATTNAQDGTGKIGEAVDLSLKL